jgi:serine/threonine protein kinase
MSQINILVSEDGVAKLSDFGHSILSGCSLLFSQSTPGGGTLRWMVSTTHLIRTDALQRNYSGPRVAQRRYFSREEPEVRRLRARNGKLIHDICSWTLFDRN